MTEDYNRNKKQKKTADGTDSKSFGNVTTKNTVPEEIDSAEKLNAEADTYTSDTWDVLYAVLWQWISLLTQITLVLRLHIS